MKFLFYSDTWQEIFEVFKKNKLRTAITMLGVLWGIFLLVFLLGLARGFENRFNDNLGDMATNSVFIWPQATSMPFKGFQKGRPLNIYIDDVQKIEQNIYGIQNVVPRNIFVSNVIKGTQQNRFTIYGDFPILDKVQKKEFIFGRFINDNDIEEKRKVVVISESVYEKLFQEGEYCIGQYISIDDVNFKIIGLVKNPKNGHEEDLIIPFTTFNNIYGFGDLISWMMITAEPDVDIKDVEEDVKLQLKLLHDVNPRDGRAFGSFNLGEVFDKITGFLTGMQFLTIFVGLATLIAGVFAIGNILLITVKERTKEIGVRRALGAKPNEIRRQIILESVFISSLSGVLGIILAGGILAFINSKTSSNPDSELLNSSVSIPAILAALAILILLGTLIGLIPAQRAIKIKPIEALREE